LFAGLLLGGLVVAWAITRDRRYLRLARQGGQVILLLAVAAGLFYVFARVLLI
jgi:Ni/Fe-hydrogenase subunit HybB-like protein